MKYNGVTGNIFMPDIGSPHGDWARPIWFIFYLHKAKLVAAEARKPYKKINGGQPTTWLSRIKKDFSEMNYTLKEAFEIAYDRDMYTQLVWRPIVWSHQADWWPKRHLKEETAGPKVCGRWHFSTRLLYRIIEGNFLLHPNLIADLPLLHQIPDFQHLILHL